MLIFTTQNLTFLSDGDWFQLFNRSSTFGLPSGLHRVRVLAVGGGAAGCEAFSFTRTQASTPVVDFIHVSGPTDINVTVGGGGTRRRNGMPSSFGSFVSAKGGAGCKPIFKATLWKDIRGIHVFRLNNITKGEICNFTCRRDN